MDTVKVFVGCASNNEDIESQAVLEWSIRKHSSSPVEIVWMQLSNDPQSQFNGWDTSRWATPFSGFRWAVPYLCNYQGKGIYCDSDFIFLSDITELWKQPFEDNKIVIAKGGDNWRLCCSLWDCSRAKEHLPTIDQIKSNAGSHAQLITKFKGSDLVQAFQGDWNNLDAKNNERLEDIDALHYTCMATQPQLRYAIPRLKFQNTKHWYDGETGPHPRQDVIELFDTLLQEAIENGYLPENYIKEHYGHMNKKSFANRSAF